ncbi:MAG: hypothetical protein M1588_04855 [Planctomycetes bacterium]|jgi:hypothetical protein|nr:hypothetical protein [Planctomycetota bacterium]
MSQAMITFDPASIVPASAEAPRVSPLRGLFWLLTLIGGVGCVTGNILIRLNFLPSAAPGSFDHIAILGLALHLGGCYLAGGAVGLAPRTKPLLALSVLVLAVNVAFLMLLIFTGPLTITHIR